MKPIQVKAHAPCQLSVKFDNGFEGSVDLSFLKGKGVFSKWYDPIFFSNVTIGKYGEIKWDNEIDLCPDSVYLLVSGKKPEDIFPFLKETRLSA